MSSIKEQGQKALLVGKSDEAKEPANAGDYDDLGRAQGPAARPVGRPEATGTPASREALAVRGGQGSKRPLLPAHGLGLGLSRVLRTPLRQGALLRQTTASRRPPQPEPGTLGAPVSIIKIAALIGCSPWTVRQTLIPRGLPHFRFAASGKLIFYTDQVVRWIENQQGGITTK